MTERHWVAVLTETEIAAANTYAALLDDVAGLADAINTGDWNLAATFAQGVHLRAPHMVDAALAAEAPGDPAARGRADEVIAAVRRQCPDDPMVTALHPES